VISPQSVISPPAHRRAARFGGTGSSLAHSAVVDHFGAEAAGHTATWHQREAGASYFNEVTLAISPDPATTALPGSTQSEQFADGH
jgi:hypothetical protein